MRGSSFEGDLQDLDPDSGRIHYTNCAVCSLTVMTYKIKLEDSKLSSAFI